jgi:hypothetical protein
MIQSRRLAYLIFGQPEKKGKPPCNFQDFGKKILVLLNSL